MIVVVEGPSAAGKTTYVTAAGGTVVVPEHAGEGPESGLSYSERAEFWAGQNRRRWEAAVQTERAHGLALCDTDPLKLHYDYCLLRIGRLERAPALAAVAACRESIADQRLGIADLVLCSVPDSDVLAERKQGDTSRSRRNFATNAQLGAPLRDWYRALEEIDPGRVRWEFPPALPDVASRARYDLDLFDSWMSRLGLTSGS